VKIECSEKGFDNRIRIIQKKSEIGEIAWGPKSVKISCSELFIKYHYSHS
jgi:hypothetical protein